MRAHRPSRITGAVFVFGLVLSSQAGRLGAAPTPPTPVKVDPISCQVLEPRQNPAKSPDLHARFAPALPQPIRGPCTAADSFAVLAPRGNLPPVYVTNFGVLAEQSLTPDDAGADAATGRKRYGFVCEENFGGKLPDHVARHPDGRLFMAGFDGLHVADDGVESCTFARAGGLVAWKDVAEVAFDPIAPTAPRRIFALGRTPAALLVSDDDGRTFTLVHTFAPEQRLGRLFVAAASPAVAARTIYVAGYSAQAALLLARSEDGGANFVLESFSSADFGRSGVITVFEGPSPAAPGTLFVATGGVSGADEIWRSIDSGHSWAKVLTLLGSESRAGFAIGDDGNAVYVAGLEFSGPAGSPAAHLYVSHDGGTTFGPPRASPPEGPRYRCLAAAQGQLYSCADPLKDHFMFGVSDDEGASWNPVVTLTDIVGPRPCTRGRCAATEFWLCQSYGICADDLPPPEQRDGQAADGATVDGTDGMDGDAGGPNGPASSGCGCRMGGPVLNLQANGRRRPGAPSGWALVGLTALSSLAGARAARRRRRPGTPRRSS